MTVGLLRVLGNLALVVGVLAAVATMVQPIRRWAMTMLASTVLASALLLWAFATDRFELLAVGNYSRSAAPLHYKLAGFWGGMAGSLLLWVTIASGLGAAIVVIDRRRVPTNPQPNSGPRPLGMRVYPAIVAIYGSAALAFANPFAVDPRPDPGGSGMAPILEHPAMVSHPPLVYAGLLLAIAPLALLLGREPRRIETVRVVARFGWAVLLVAMTVGAWWAYAEVGWGGFWAWDPVENSSLLPWLGLTAVLHAMYDRPAGRTTLRWAAASAGLAIAGSVLARSGSISSVHAFAESGAIGAWVLAWAGAAVLAATILARRDGSLVPPVASPTRSSPLWLRLLLATIGTAIAIVAVGTIRPLATIGPAAERVAVAPRFFAMFTGPLALLLLATMGTGQAIAAGSPGRLQDLARRPPAAYVAAGAVGAAMVAAATLGGAWRSPIGSIGVVLAVASAVTALVSGWGRVSPPSLVVHLGFALLSLGVAGSVSTVSTAQTIETGETAALAGYQVTLLDVGAERPSGDDADDPDVEAEIVARVRLVGHGQEFDAEPKLVGFRRQRTVLSETVLATAMADTQIALRNADDEGRALIEVSRKPLVNLVWTGAGVMLAGIAASSLARRRPPTRSS